jgi:hypothetical protein
MVLLHSALLFWMLLVFNFPAPSITEFPVFNLYCYSKTCPSARPASSSSVLCRGVDVFGTNIILLISS